MLHRSEPWIGDEIHGNPQIFYNEIFCETRYPWTWNTPRK